ncbi:hypothetical protein D3C80_1472560 [compost metagenome]
MTRYFDHPKALAEHLDLVAFAQGQIARGDLFLRRAEYPCPGGRLQRLDAAHMVGVMVGDQNIAQSPVRVAVQPGQHRRRITGVDHRAAALREVLQQPDIVVREGGQGVDLYHHAGR